MKKLGLFLENGIAKAKQLFAKNIRTEILEMIDKSTGEIYCTWIENGEWVKVKGECGGLSNDSASPVPSAEGGATGQATSQTGAPVGEPAIEEQPSTEQPPAEESPPGQQSIEQLIEQPKIEMQQPIQKTPVEQQPATK